MTDAQQAPRPRRVEMSDDGRAITLTYAEEPPVTLTAEFLRVFSPSAEVVGHAPGQEVLQTGKRNVRIRDIQPTGHYALRFVFDDGHDSGLYTWGYLRFLCEHRDEYWEGYLRRLEAEGKSRDPEESPAT
ncbi:DUF971 domain-containing protein [Hahella sp. SMD15-11]|uniref:DUF971 domain-containing protein n=1 Tax=Thermohahella caldifontis TaxID=3142973 RepID=A0AB39USV2_9GAMM